MLQGRSLSRGRVRTRTASSVRRWLFDDSGRGKLPASERRSQQVGPISDIATTCGCRASFGVWLAVGHQPSYGDMRHQVSRFSPEGYAKRYGSWTDALLAFQSWVDDRDDSDGEESSIPRADRVERPGQRARSRTLGVSLRWKVIQRDRFPCVACGASPATVPSTILHVDHVVPFSKGV